MGLFDKLFKAKDSTIALGAPINGIAISLKEVSDPTFGDEILGKGVAIKPEGNQIFSPTDGVVDLMFDTGHAVNIKSTDGVEILIHVGLDTVSLKGEGFKTFKKTDESVRKGDLLIEFDKNLLLERGFDTIVPIIICNTDEYKDVKAIVGKTVSKGDDVILITKE